MYWKTLSQNWITSCTAETPASAHKRHQMLALGRLSDVWPGVNNNKARAITIWLTFRVCRWRPTWAQSARIRAERQGERARTCSTEPQQTCDYIFYWEDVIEVQAGCKRHVCRFTPALQRYIIGNFIRCVGFVVVKTTHTKRRQTTHL